MKFYFLFLILGLSFNPALTQMAFGEDQHSSQGKSQHGDHKDHNHKDQQATSQTTSDGKVLIKVKGMVCAFCAQGIEKNFNAREEVKSTKVDLDKMEVLIELKPGKSISEEVIKKIVTDAGFSYAGVQK